MQNKGLIRFFAIALALVSLFYLSFSAVTAIYDGKADDYANIATTSVQNTTPFKELPSEVLQIKTDSVREMAKQGYIDSISREKVYLGYTLKECREKELNLGLDLKGGMNVILEISVPDIIRSLSDYKMTPNFNKALKMASEKQKSSSGTPYLDLFVESYKEIDPEIQLAPIFVTLGLKEKIRMNTPNEEVINVLRNEIDGAIENSFNVLRTRIDRFGVVQPKIQRLENSGRILIELPGIKEPERVRKLLQGSANLEFWETYDVGEIISNIANANSVIAEIQKENTPEPVAETPNEVAETEVPVVLSKVDSLKQALNQTKTNATDSLKQIEEARRNNPLFTVLSPSQAQRGPVVGYAQAKDTALINYYFNLKQVKEVLPRDLGLRWTVKPVEENSEIYQLVAIKMTNREGQAPLTGAAITDAHSDFTQNANRAEVSMSMNVEGAKTWARLTKENIGKSVAISLDGYIYSFPTVQVEIKGGRSSITGNFTVEEAKDLANVLKSGKMPAPAHIVQEDVVGPSLGQEAINNGLWSFVIAFILILIYMIFYYGLIPGLIADIALFVNVFFLMGILASFSAVLTLPGIAGIVLTLGMAVDGNVLIYERIREELLKGKNLRKAIKDGFGNAISAIIDANVTTMITGVVLFLFGTGPILGFASTLIIGIITSFITAVFLTRLMLETYAARTDAKPITFTTKITKAWFQNTKIDFIGKRKTGYIISAILIGIAIVGLSTKGLSAGIDFSGGRNYIVQFDDQVSAEEVRELLGNTFEGAEAKVISIGSDGNKVRISTKYKIDSDNQNTDNEIEILLYEGLKSKLDANTTFDEFKSEKYIVNSAKVGPTIADDIKTSAVWAIIISLFFVALYIFIRFNDLAFSIGAFASLAHDVLVILGAYAILWGILPFSMEIDQSFIAAILTIVGYSVNDTVVIFDRIRENTQLYPKRNRLEVMNESLNDTLSRTFSTSMSVLVVMVAIFLFGGDTIQGFIFALLLGTVFGVYSTLFVAVPLAYDIIERKTKKNTEKTPAKKQKK